jgi:hypothetical protein
MPVAANEVKALNTDLTILFFLPALQVGAKRRRQLTCAWNY